MLKGYKSVHVISGTLKAPNRPHITPSNMKLWQDVSSYDGSWTPQLLPLQRVYTYAKAAECLCKSRSDFRNGCQLKLADCTCRQRILPLSLYGHMHISMTKAWLIHRYESKLAYRQLDCMVCCDLAKQNSIQLLCRALFNQSSYIASRMDSRKAPMSALL